MNARHTVVVLVVLAVTSASGARAQDDVDLEHVVNDENGGIAPTDAAVFGGFSGTFAGALVGIGAGALTQLVSDDDNVAVAAWAATVSMGAGAGAGLARSLAGDPQHQQSAAVVTTLGTAAAGVVGAMSGVLIGHTQGDGITGAAMGFAVGTLVGAVAAPIAHGLVVE